VQLRRCVAGSPFNVQERRQQYSQKIKARVVQLESAAEHGGRRSAATVTKTPVLGHGVLDKQILQRANRSRGVVVHIVSVGARKQDGVATRQARVFAVVQLEPAIAPQHDVKDGAAGKIYVQAPRCAQFRAAEDHRFQRDGLQDLRYKVLRSEISQQPNA
jgi:hypothetical protein